MLGQSQIISWSKMLSPSSLQTVALVKMTSPKKPPLCLFADNSSGKPKFRLAAEGQIQLPQGLKPELIPKHVAVIMDGNRRWAEKRGLPAIHGQRAGANAIKQLAINCKKYGIKVLTCFAFSTENWGRPQEQVKTLMDLFEESALSDMGELMKHDVRVTVLGNRSGLPQSIQKLIPAVEELTKDNKGLNLAVAINYGGRYEITEAAKKIASKVKDGFYKVEDIDEIIVEQHLQTNGIEFPNPDLLVRTSESRLSNFMLWQLAYTQLFFSDKLFPDFDEADLIRALAAYQHSQIESHSIY